MKCRLSTNEPLNQVLRNASIWRNVIFVGVLLFGSLASFQQADAQSANRTLYWHGNGANGNWLEDFCFVNPNPAHCYFDDLDVAVTLHTETAFGDTYGADFKLVNVASDPDPQLYFFQAGAFGAPVINANVDFPNPPFTLHFPHGWQEI